MAGSNAGTGYPLTLRCAKCKIGRDYEHGAGRQGTNIEATGRTAPLTSKQQGSGNPRAIYFRAEYKCRDCGHTGWSRHSSIVWIARHGGITLTVPKSAPHRRGDIWVLPERLQLDPLYGRHIVKEAAYNEDGEHVLVMSSGGDARSVKNLEARGWYRITGAT